MNRKVLIIDDNERIVESLSDLLVPLGYGVFSALNTREAVAVAKLEKVHVALLDIKLGSESGIDCLRELLKIDTHLPVIMITGFATVDNAVEAMKLGAFDYFKKPLDFERLLKVLDNAIDLRVLKEENRELRARIGEAKPSLTYKSEGMKELLDKAAMIAGTEIPVLLIGENGTGKEMIADMIHERSRRSRKQFLKINCAAFPESLLDNELFGHEKGSYTGAIGDFQGIFERADGGTLFLDEIGDMPLTIQAKILRVLQNNEIRRIGGKENISIDVRFIAATNKDLAAMIGAGLFREDLYYRLNAATLSVPPLRERIEDLPDLVEAFLKEYAEGNSTPKKRVAKEVQECFLNYRWPGNVRELKNTVMYISAISKGDTITLDTLPPIFTTPKDAGHIEPATHRLQDVERSKIAEVLKNAGGNKKKAAELLGLSRNTLYRKLRTYGLYDDD